MNGKQSALKCRIDRHFDVMPMSEVSLVLTCARPDNVRNYLSEYDTEFVLLRILEASS